jgi:KaiC/GvpD/RAD55 family RecA-like ATPase
MYDLGPRFGDATVEPGTNVLVSGPPLSGKRRLALEILARGAAEGEGSIVVSARDGADSLLADYRSLLGESGDTPVGVVDCVTKHVGRSAADADPVRYAASPADLTGIGIEFSAFVDSFRDDRGLRHTRVALADLTTLLIYTDRQSVFRFVHVVGSRIEDANALGVHVVESHAHDDETLHTLRPLFDAVVETDRSGGVSVRPVDDQSDRNPDPDPDADRAGG